MSCWTLLSERQQLADVVSDWDVDGKHGKHPIIRLFELHGIQVLFRNWIEHAEW